MKLNNKQIEFCHLIAEDLYKASTAYRKVYGHTMSPNVSANSAHKLLQKEEVKRYLQFIQDEISDLYKITRETQIKDLQHEKDDYLEMKALGRKDVLTDDEQTKYDRMMKNFKGTDYNKSMDMLNRMIGAYEVDNEQTKSEWTINYGTNDDDDNTTD